jgi:hypothetical protein
MKINQIFDELDRQPRNDGFISADSLQWSTTNATSNWGQLQVGNSVWVPETKKVSVITKIKIWGIKVWTKTREIEPEVFFDTLKRDKKQVKIINGIVDKYLSSIEKAEKFGQTALVEKMKDDIEVVKKEALACANGVKEYLTDKQVEKLMSKSSKNIEIDDIKNFVRHLPENLIEKVEKLKSDNVFDKYVVMHYDPKKENTELTKKEKEKKRDPILFGMIKGSRNMYFIGDWVDEYCDLTLKEAVAIIEEKTKKIRAK